MCRYKFLNELFKLSKPSPKTCMGEILIKCSDTYALFAVFANFCANDHFKFSHAIMFEKTSSKFL